MDGKEVTMQVKVGDQVIFSNYSVTEVKTDDAESVSYTLLDVYKRQFRHCSNR